MKLRGNLNALIGVWFIIAPWAIGYSDQSGALWSSIIFGIIQVIVSLWGYDKPGWNSWQNWISTITGVWFVIFPFIYSLTNGEVWSSVILGLITIIFSLWNLGSNSGSKAVVKNKTDRNPLFEQTTQDALQRQLTIDYHSGKRKTY